MTSVGTKRKKTTTDTSDNISSSSINNSNSSKTAKMWKSNKTKKKSAGSDSHKVAEELFAEIADPDDPQTANMEGIFELGQKLGVDAVEDISLLVLLWRLGCSGNPPGSVSLAEWTAGCSKLRVDSWQALQGQLPAADTGFLDQTEFRDFFKFCFQFNLSGTHRTLDKELVVALLPMVLKDRVAKDRLTTFLEFLESCTEYGRITLDQWTSFLDFCLEVPDLKDYDESTSAWPVLLDEYVEYMESK